MIPVMWFATATANLACGNLWFGALCSVAGLVSVLFGTDDDE